MEPGQGIGHYRVLETLGTGAQGAVYLAEDLHLGRKVALKVLFGAALGQSQAFLRFQREAAAASRLDHPGICTVYDADRVDETAYIAMRYLEGEPLSALIGRVRSAVDVPGSDSRASHTTTRRDELFARIRIVEQVAHALHAAHEVGLVHRDVKPSNIMLLDGDEPVLCDFGLVHDEGPDSHALTRTGDVFGTPLYMSPEQIQGRHTDRRSDVFSLGVVAFELLTGHRPFTGASYADLYQAVTERAPPNPARLGVVLPHDLGIVLETALDKDPDRRYATAALFADDLRRVRAFEPIRARPIGPGLRLRRWVQRRPARAAALALAALLVVGGPAVFGLQQRRARASILAEKNESDRQRRRAERISYAAGVAAAAANLQAWQIAEAKRRLSDCPEYLRGWEWHVLSNLADSSELLYTLEPGPPVPSSVPGAPVRLEPFAAIRRGLAIHGDRIAFAAANHSVHVLDLATRRLTTLAGHTHNVIALAFSPDGTRIASASWDRTVRIWDVATGTVLHTLEGHAEGLVAVAFAGDGAVLATCDQAGGIRLWDVASGECRFRDTSGNRTSRDLVATPDGTRVLAAHRDAIEEIDVATGRTVRCLAKARNLVMHLALDPSGTRLAAVSSDVTVFEGQSGARIHTISVEAEGRMTDLIYANKGRLLAATFQDGSVQAWDAASGAPVFSRAGHDQFPTAIVWSDRHGLITWGMDQTLRRWRLDPCFARATLAVDGAQTRVAFDPTGRRVVAGGWSGIVRVFDYASGREVAALRGHSNRVTDLACSPDGRWIASTGLDGTVRLWEGEDGRVLARCGARLEAICFSPDGRQLAFGGLADRIVVWDVAADRPAVELPVDETVNDLAYDPPGETLAAAFDDGTIRIWNVARRTLVARWVAHVGGTRRITFDAERDELISGGRNGVVRIWQHDRGAWCCRRELRGHRAAIAAVAPSGPEHRYFTASADRTIRVWDADTGETLTSLLDVAYPTDLVVRPDGKAIAVAGHGRNLHILESAPR